MIRSKTVLKCENLEVILDAEGSMPTPIIYPTSLSIQQGEWIGVVGETGAGKSTLARALSALPMGPELHRTGQIYLNEENLLALPYHKRAKVWGHTLAYLHQESALSLNPTIKILSQILEGLQLHYPKNTKKENLEKISFWLKALHLPNTEQIKQQYAHELSGGMQQKILLAMVLTLDPSLIIADEFTSSLDMINQHCVMEALLLYKKMKPHMGLFFVTHNLKLALRYCDKIIVLYRGDVVEEISTIRLKKSRLHPYTQALLSIFPIDPKDPVRSSIPPHSPSLTKEWGCPFFKFCSYSHKRCHQEKPKLLSCEPCHQVACHLFDYETKHTTS